MVGVDTVLPALQGSDQEPLQGLHLPHSSAWGCPMHRGDWGGRGPASEGGLPQLRHVPSGRSLGPMGAMVFLRHVLGAVPPEPGMQPAPHP